MSCSPFDLKDFFFGELESADRAAMEAHLRECRGCREELDRLRLTQAALGALREEEPPRRIAFVSDKIFEPRWWQAWWRSAPRLGFAAAAMLSVALLAHTFIRPAPNAPVARIGSAAIETRVETETARRVEAAVQAAIAESEARQARKASEMVEAARRDLEFQRQADRVAFQETLTLLQKRYNLLLVASNEYGGLP
jgi:anti-sigma factor RsiW